jgi:hypothetical protein
LGALAKNQASLLPAFLSSHIHTFRASRASSFSFIPIPPENPPSEPAELITRCQGMMIGNGFAPSAWPTARAARVFLILLAIHA